MAKINRKISFIAYANMHRNPTKLIQWGVKTDVHACAYFNIYYKYKTMHIIYPPTHIPVGNYHLF